MSTARVVVLGASGFVGRHVCEALGPGRDVVVMPQVGAIEDHASLERVEAEVCVHLAEPSALTDPSIGVANIERARRVLARPFRRIVYMSSGVVYGDREATPRRETDPTIASSEYAKAKLDVEAVMRNDPRCAIVRAGNVYGRGMSPNNVLSDILAQLPGAGPLKVRDLASVRDYIHVSDVARAMAKLIDAPLVGIVNIGSGAGTSVRALARIACIAAGQPDRVLEATLPRDQDSILVLDIDRARSELAWAPTVALDQGVSQLISGKAA